MANMIEVTICYCSKDKQYLKSVMLAEGATVEQAIHATDVLQQFPEIDLSVNKLGIFAQAVNLEERLRSGDRVEIYRPLEIDPKQARRNRAIKD